MRIVSKLLIILLFTRLGSAQNKFSRVYGNENLQQAYDIIEGNNGKYVIVGTYDIGGFQTEIFFSEIDTMGEPIFSKTLGDKIDSSANKVTHTFGNQAFCVSKTWDKGYIVSGESHDSTSSYADILVFKLDSLGDTVWLKAYGDEFHEYGNCIIEASDSSYVIAGTKEDFSSGVEVDALIFKINSSGDTLWTKTFGGDGQDVLKQVIETPDGGYMAAGYSNSWSLPWSNIYLVKLDKNGVIEWEKILGDFYDQRAFSIANTKDSGAIITGSTEGSAIDEKDAFLLKVNATGEQEWFRTYGGEGFDIANDVIQKQNGDIVLVGHTTSYGYGNEDVLVVSTNEEGVLKWARVYGGKFIDVGSSIINDSQNGGTIVGYTGSYGAGGLDMLVLGIDSNGEGDCIGLEISNISTDLISIKDSLVTTPIKKSFKVSSIKKIVGNTNIILNDVCQLVGFEYTKPDVSGLLKVIPNPAYGIIKIETGEVDYQIVELIDVKGQVMYSDKHRSDVLDINWLPSGLYLLNLYHDNGKQTARFFKE